MQALNGPGALGVLPVDAATDIALAGLVPPAVISAGALVLAWKPWRREARESGRRSAWGPPVSLGLGYAAGHVGIHGWPPLALQVSIKQGLFYVALLATILGLVEVSRGRASLLTRAIFSLAAPLYLLDFMRAHAWSELSVSLAWNAGLAVALFLGWTGVDGLARRRAGPSLPAAWGLALAFFGGALQLSGSLTLAQLAGALAAPLGVATLLAFARPGEKLGSGGAGCVALLYAGLLWAGFFASNLEAASAGLLALAPLMPWLLELLPEGSGAARRPLVRALLAMLLVALPGALAVGVELATRPPAYPGY